MEEESRLVETQVIIDSAIQSFIDKVKHSNRSWIRQTKKTDSSFVLLHPANSEFFAFQRYETTLEWYIREYLANGIIIKMLRARDVSFHDFNEKEHIRTTGESIGYTCNLDNSIFEEIYPFEFIILENGEKVGIRYLPIKANRAKELLEQGVADRILIVRWIEDKDCSLDNESYFPLNSQLRDKVFRITLQSFFKRYFSTNEFEMFLEKARKAVDEANHIIGFQTISQLSPRNVSDYKIHIIDDLKNLDYQRMAFIPRNESMVSVPVLSVADKTILIEHFLNKKIYRALAGEKDFAICFFTSEYLYQTCRDQNNFDYTSVVAGYLKAVEQLVYAILIALMNDKWKKTILIKRRHSTKKYPDEVEQATRVIGKAKMIPVSEEYKEYFDTTLVPMTNAILFDSAGWRVPSSKDTIKNYIYLFSQDCRNEHFHKHNITDWTEVERIRNNTILCLLCLLGGSVYCDTSEDGNQTIGAVDDSYDRLYKALQKISPGRKHFVLSFANGETVKAIRLQHQDEERYSDSGYALSAIRFVRVNDFKGIDYREIEKDPSSYGEVIITRDNMPIKVECVSYRGSVPII